MRFVNQLWYLVQGLSESFSWVFMFIALLPFLFFFKMQKRERSWIAGLTAIYFCLAVLLVNLLNVGWTALRRISTKCSSPPHTRCSPS